MVDNIKEKTCQRKNELKSERNINSFLFFFRGINSDGDSVFVFTRMLLLISIQNLSINISKKI